MARRHGNRNDQGAPEADVVLVGGGIMSATLGSLLAVLEPDWKIVLVERARTVASESSGPWNNAGTGHSGYCELNYMPDPEDGARAATIARQFQLTREWWAFLAARGRVDPSKFVHHTPHVDVVFGERDVDYLRRRYRTLRADPLFARMQFSDDPDTIATWAPLVTAGRPVDEPIAATRVVGGTDVDFGALTEQLVGIITETGGRALLGHEVRSLRRMRAGGWTVRGRHAEGRFTIRARHVFVGAGGYALKLLQKARLPEVRGYAVLPVGAAFLRCADPAVVARHDCKVYGQSEVGAPPMSVPHLDKRVVDGAEYLMFGPYATFSTKLLVHGRLTDWFTTLRPGNLHVLAAAVVQNSALVRYLIGQLVAGRRSKDVQLRRYFPTAKPADWELIAAGQRAQLVTPDPRRIGVLQQGTELVTSRDGSIAGLLGASPGASTAVPIMLDLLRRCFPEYRDTWGALLDEAIPSRTVATWTRTAAERALHTSARALHLVPAVRPDESSAG